MRKRWIAAALLVATAATARGSAQSNGQVMSGLTLQPVPTPAPKTFTLRIPAPDGQRPATALNTEASRRLQAEIAKPRNPGTPTVVCGMTVLRADPAFDAGIRKAPPTDRVFPLRTVQPTVCASQAGR